MYGIPISVAIRWMASASLRACCSDSSTHGPAIRNSPPAPAATLPILKRCEVECTRAILALNRWLAAHRSSQPCEHQRQKREPAATLFAVHAPNQLPQTGRPLLLAMLLAGLRHRLCDILQDLGIKAAQ